MIVYIPIPSISSLDFNKFYRIEVAEYALSVPVLLQYSIKFMERRRNLSRMSLAKLL